jgi:hypothetical protein
MSQSRGTVGRGIPGRGMDFPHLLDYGVVGLLVFLLLLGV